MKTVIEPSMSVAGQIIRVVLEIETNATRLPFSGIAGSGSKRPVAIIFGTGPTARLVGLDGTTRDPSEIGLRPEGMESDVCPIHA